VAGKNRPANEFHGQVCATKQPLRQQRLLLVEKLPGRAGFSPVVADPKQSETT
jgi:hypothetical protein